jgi:hypothetical protein
MSPDTPEPREIIKSSWFNHPYTKGSYSSVSYGSTEDDFDTLAEPVSFKNVK